MNNMTKQINQPKPRVLFVDDEEAILKSLKRFGRVSGWDVSTSLSGEDALKQAESHTYDAIVSDMRMPEMNGAELLKEFSDHHPSTIRILLTGYSDIDMLGNAINDGHIHNYLTKPWDDNLLFKVISDATQIRKAETKRKKSEQHTKEQNIKLSKLALLLDKQVKERTMEVDQALSLLQDSHEQSQNSILDSVAVINRILEWKESKAHGQSEFVTFYAVGIAKTLHFSDTDIETIRLASLLHRIGLLALPDHIRTKPVYTLTKEEQILYQQYPIWSERCIKHSENLNGVAKIVRHHREYINGNGYPDGLTEKSIPIAAQIVGLVSDFYDAYSGQIDRSIHGAEKAKVYLKEWAGRRHDTALVNVFMTVLGDFCDTLLNTSIVFTKDLNVGMILNEDIRTQAGTFLLSKGTKITYSHIKKLLEYERKFREVFEISIQTPLPEEEPLK